MTREEAINLLESYLGISPEPLTDTVEERMTALEIAVEALKHDGWHPVSESPKVGSVCITWCVSKNKRTPNGMSYIEMRLYAEDGWHGANINQVKYWCYPPKE